MMPKGDVTQRQQEVPNPKGGTVKVQQHFVKRGAANALILSIIDAPPSVGSGEQLVSGAREQLKAVLPGAKVTDEKKLTIDGHPGIELTVEIPGVGMTRARVAAVGQRVYQASVEGTKEFATSAEADRYLQSLKIQARADKGVPVNPGAGVKGNPGGGAPAGAISAVDLVRTYQKNRAAADKQYTGKVITVQGTVRDRQPGIVNLQTGLPSILPGAAPGTTDIVEVHFRNAASAANIRPGTSITVTGRCEGFDEYFDVVLRDAQLVSK
jgi:hypothetical protein